MGDKREARLPPEENEARQEARRLKRQSSKDASVIAITASLLMIEAAVRHRELGEDDAVGDASDLLEMAHDAAAKIVR